MAADPSSLSAAQRGKIRRLSRPEEAAPGEDAGELNIVPYLDIITNIMMFVLASVSVAFVSTIGSEAALANPRLAPPHNERALRLTALVTAQGVALTTADGHVAAGCNGLGAGVTVPRLGEGHDLGSLTACARRIKGAQASYAGETQVTLSASPDVAYAEVVSVMDALRSDDSGELFPSVVFGVVR